MDEVYITSAYISASPPVSPDNILLLVFLQGSPINTFAAGWTYL